MLISSCNSKKEELPIYGATKVILDEKGDSVIVHHQIADFEFLNQDGRLVTNHDFEGGVYIANFFFTRCLSICPPMQEKVATLYHKFKQNSQVKFLSHSIDNQHDNPDILKDYAQKWNVNTKIWHFVTGSQDSIYDIARNSYQTSFLQTGTDSQDFIHSTILILIDQKRQIRGYYDSTNPEELEKLEENIETLLELF